MTRRTRAAFVLLLAANAPLVGACPRKTVDDVRSDGTKAIPPKASDSQGGATSPARLAAEIEARRMIGVMENSSKGMFNGGKEWFDAGVSATFCPSSAAPVPPTIPTRPTSTTASDWDTPTWRCLRVDFDWMRAMKVDPEALRCQYAYQSNGKSGVDAAYTAIGRCDPDGDGRLFTITLKGQGDASGEARRVSVEQTGD